jgi:hypothetical protein
LARLVIGLMHSLLPAPSLHGYSRPPPDFVSSEFERHHDRFRLSDGEEGVNASSILADVVHYGTSDNGSNRCLFSTNGHEAPLVAW